ncbi:pyridine nucleotide-disulfide oxidoreductase [Streptomyces umbrinus]|uniref:NAD(P)/FAD-dependent oxidoreductase n=1 Tax=Streptomyces umbrinus TaxID=67370 RepID=UPI0016727284|nr:FAD/NAD(P)-binding oxidoreductase [Streptomyces umbrinus]GHB59277.1 pyridine nucleotide-disulfide oxidoreductase [Streptomyces umbrinus]
MTAHTTDVAIVGGSTAGLRAAEAVVRHAPELSVTVISDEPHLPYELPPLSKTALDDRLDVDALVYPFAGSLRDRGVDFRLNTRAQSLDTKSNTVLLPDGTLSYRALVIATGCEAIVPPLFAGRFHVHALRRFEDATALRAAVADPGASVAIVGAGFIGGEFASTLVKAKRTVSLIDLAAKPLGRFGDQVADAYAALHRDAGVGLFLGSGVVDVVERNGRRSVVLDDGTRVPADVIVVGVGVRPSVDWLRSSGLTFDNGILADATLRAADNVFVAGDVVRWPNARFGTTMRIEHWTSAAEQGRAAGANAVRLISGSKGENFANVPYFWSDQHGVRIQFAGCLTGDEEIVESRTADGRLFLYHRGESVAGVLAFERRAEFVKLRALLRRELSLRTASEFIPSVRSNSGA